MSKDDKPLDPNDQMEKSLRDLDIVNESLTDLGDVLSSPQKQEISTTRLSDIARSVLNTDQKEQAKHRLLI